MAKYDVQLPDFASLFSLDGKVAVVTGGSRGLGTYAPLPLPSTLTLPSPPTPHHSTPDQSPPLSQSD